jgi:cyclopropane-fatty-acyl-phospholipid synthase
MKTTLTHSQTFTADRPRLGLLDRIGRRALFSRLHCLQRGRITVLEGQERRTFGSLSTEYPLQATILVHDPRCYSEIAFGGSIGAGATYADGHWSCDDLTALVRIFVLNRAVLDGMEKGLAWLTTPLQQAYHRVRSNSKSGSRSNIAAHYDLGNEFFSIMLDETMMYSCAFFEREDSTLFEASIVKNDRICKKLQLGPHDHLLEIGTGWGGFAIQAAKDYGCRVTTTTISHQQYEVAVRRIKEAGLSDRITVVMKDYRDLHELGITFDKLVSIEMIEAVGHAYFDTYFKSCSDLLKPQGTMLLQAITIEDQQYERAKRSVDFIQRYIFPGSCIPSITALCTSITRATDMTLFHLEDIGAHYPATLRGWKERLASNLAQVRALGYPESFIRLWEFYLCYCEGGFLERSISDVQMLLVKPGYRVRVRRET